MLSSIATIESRVCHLKSSKNPWRLFKSAHKKACRWELCFGWLRWHTCAWCHIRHSTKWECHVVATATTHPRLISIQPLSGGLCARLDINYYCLSPLMRTTATIRNMNVEAVLTNSLLCRRRGGRLPNDARGARDQSTLQHTQMPCSASILRASFSVVCTWYGTGRGVCHNYAQRRKEEKFEERAKRKVYTCAHSYKDGSHIYVVYMDLHTYTYIKHV